MKPREYAAYSEDKKSKNKDRLGRWLFTTHTTHPIDCFVPDARQIRWMQLLNIHGLASSKYLHEFTADTHICPQTSGRMLRKLFDGQMVFKPKQQRETEGADAHHHVYALTNKGISFLKREDLWVDALKLTGPWVHQYMIACITSSIHIHCRRHGLNYIPGHEITADLSTIVPFIWKRRRYEYNLIPDSMFAIRYGKGFIAYLVEADRNTEPNDPATPHRKSARRSIKQYAEFIGNKRYKKRFSLNCPLIVVNVTVSPEHITRALQIIDEEIGACSYLAYEAVPAFKTPFKVPTDLLLKKDLVLVRNGNEPFELIK